MSLKHTLMSQLINLYESRITIVLVFSWFWNSDESVVKTNFAWELIDDLLHLLLKYYCSELCKISVNHFKPGKKNV